MKKVFKLSMVSLIALFAMFTLVGCAKVSESFAEKINEKAEAKEYYTYEELVEKLGDPTLDVSGSISIGGLEVKPTGVAVWVDGYENMDDVEEALEDGKTIKSLTVTFLDGNATKAEYDEEKSE